MVGNTFSGTLASFVLNSNAVALSVTSPANVAVGVPFTVTVTALDQHGNTATGYMGTVAFSTTDAGRTLPANYTFVAGDAGVHTFTVTLKTTGSYSLTVADSTNGLTATNPIIVSAQGYHALSSVTGVPSNTTAGSNFTFTVTALDALNNTAVGYTGGIHFTSNDPLASLPANTTLTGGSHSFSAAFQTAGTGKTITATSTVTTTIKGTSTASTAARRRQRLHLHDPGDRRRQHGGSASRSRRRMRTATQPRRRSSSAAAMAPQPCPAIPPSRPRAPRSPA